MRGIISNPSKSATQWVFIGIFAASSFASAQDTGAPVPPAPPDQQQTASSNGGWKRVGDGNGASSYQDPNTTQPAPPTQAAPPNQAPQNQPPSNQGPPPAYSQQGPYAPQPPYAQQQPGYPPQGPYQQSGPYQQPNYNASQPPQNYPAPPPVPQNLIIPAGSFLTVRVNQGLSSDRNHAGDAFSATLEQPLVVNGVVVAEPGQTLGGRVAEAEKAGRVEGVARLAVQLTELTLVDGQQLPLQAQLISRKGPTSTGQDAGVIAGTTGLGAAIGAAAGWGKGAAIGAGAGAVAGIAGVLLTRGHPSVIYPEELLTFRIDRQLNVFTGNSPQAFRYVQPGEYDRPGSQPAMGMNTAGMAPPAPYYAAPYPYPYSYPYYWGPSFSFYYGPRFWYGGRFYGGRGFYHR